MGTTFQTLFDWENGSRDAALGSICSDTIKKAKGIIAQYDELMALEGLDNPVLYMFRSKNFFGLSDKQEITVTPRQAIEATQAPDQIAAQIEADIPLDQ